MRKCAAGAVLLASVMLGAAPRASAQGTQGAFKCPAPDAAREKNARAMFDEAVQLEPSDPEGALARYQCAATLAAKPAIELRIGVVAERLHRDNVAIVHFERYLDLAGSSAPDAESMRAHVRELRAKHDREAKAAQSVQSASSDSAASAPPPDEANANVSADAETSSPERTWIGVGLVGLGVVLGGVGSGFLLDAKSKNDDVHALPPGTPWASEEARGTYDAAGRSQTIGIVCLVIAPAALIAGAVLLLTRSSRSPAPASSGAGASPRHSFAHPLTLRF